MRPGSRATGFDWNDRSTWAPRRSRASTPPTSPTSPTSPWRARRRPIGAFSQLAAAHGVKRLVLLSGRGEAEAQRAEREMAAAGTEWTVVRCSWFAQNFSEAFMVDGVLAGEVALPAGEIPEPFVDAEDIADVAVAALTEDGHDGQVYELTGPRALASTMPWPRSPPRPAARSASRRSRSTPSPPACARPACPTTRPRWSRWLFTEILDGRNAEPQDGVRRALGRAPRDFGEYARTDRAADGRVESHRPEGDASGSSDVAARERATWSRWGAYGLE